MSLHNTLNLTTKGTEIYTKTTKKLFKIDFKVKFLR